LLRNEQTEDDADDGQRGGGKKFLQKLKISLDNFGGGFRIFPSQLGSGSLWSQATPVGKVVNAELYGLSRCEYCWTNLPLFWSPNLTGLVRRNAQAGEVWAFCFFVLEFNRPEKR
jgi:hypothetical protein